MKVDVNVEKTYMYAKGTDRDVSVLFYVEIQTTCCFDVWIKVNN